MKKYLLLKKISNVILVCIITIAIIALFFKEYLSINVSRILLNILIVLVISFPVVEFLKKKKNNDS